MARESSVRIAAKALAAAAGFSPCTHPDCDPWNVLTGCASNNFFRKAVGLAEDAIAAGIELERRRGRRTRRTVAHGARLNSRKGKRP